MRLERALGQVGASHEAVAAHEGLGHVDALHGVERHDGRTVVDRRDGRHLRTARGVQHGRHEGSL